MFNIEFVPKFKIVSLISNKKINKLTEDKNASNLLLMRE